MNKNRYSIVRGEGKQLTNAVRWFSDRAVISEFLDALELIANKLPPKINLLEIGAGTGVLGFAVKQHFKDLGKEVSLVLSDRNISDLVTNEAKVIKAENKHLPFENESFDLIISRSVTHYEKDNLDEIFVLKEIQRVMKCSGQYIAQNLYLPNTKEVRLHQDINDIVYKKTNAKTYKNLIQMHKKVFSKTDVLVKRIKHPLTVDRQAYLKRYNLDKKSGDLILEKIKKVNKKEIPNFWVNNNNFGWSIDYAILVCTK